MSVSDEAVEAAAIAAFSRTHPHGNWWLAASDFRVRYLAEARAALEVTSPHLVTCGYCYAEVKDENSSMHEEWHRTLRGW